MTSFAALQLPPLRSLDDFAMGSARFQLPNLKDLEKWGNRVIKNLLYYQSNYFLMCLGIYGLMMCLYPVKITCGLAVHAMLITIFLHFFRSNTFGSTTLKPTTLKPTFTASNGPNGTLLQHKWYALAGAFLIAYLLLHYVEAILLSTFTLLLPIALIFIHASLRLRNIKNKVVNTMESFSAPTLMGAFLDAFNITADSILS